MAKIIDLDFYRKFRIILPIRQETTRPQVLKKDKAPAQQIKRFRRKRKGDGDKTN